MIQHKHVIIRAETASAPDKSLFNEELLNSTIEQLIVDIGMKVVLPARCVWVGQEGNEGYTGQAGLETSHIAYHIWNNPDENILLDAGNALFQLDLYTCGCLGSEQIVKIVEWVDSVWKVKVLDLVLIEREELIEVEKTVLICDYDTDDNNIQQALALDLRNVYK